MPPYRGRAVSVGRRRGSRRKLVWATNQLASTSVGAGAKLNMVDLLGNLETPGASTLGATVMRTRMNVAATFLTTDTGPGVIFGLIVDDAVTVTNLDPANAFGDDWMLLRTFGPTAAYPGTATVQGTNWFCSLMIDLRAKRKIEELAERYFLCMTNQGSAAVQFGAFTRTLIALP
jgi:hypothetical protein